MEKSHVFYVRGMSCGGCARKVKESVGSNPGVHAVEVDLEIGSVTVQFNCCQATIEQMEKSIVASGFQVIK